MKILGTPEAGTIFTLDFLCVNQRGSIQVESTAFDTHKEG